MYAAPRPWLTASPNLLNRRHDPVHQLAEDGVPRRRGQDAVEDALLADCGVLRAPRREHRVAVRRVRPAGHDVVDTRPVDVERVAQRLQHNHVDVQVDAAVQVEQHVAKKVRLVRAVVQRMKGAIVGALVRFRERGEVLEDSGVVHYAVAKFWTLLCD